MANTDLGSSAFQEACAATLEELAPGPATPQDSHSFLVTAVTNHAQNIQHFGIKKVGLLPKTVIALIPK